MLKSNSGVGKMLNELAKRINRMAKSKGWWDEDRHFGDVLSNIHAELSEAWEEFRKNKTYTEVYFNNSENQEYPKPEGIPIELADTLIRILDFCGEKDINIEAAILMKMQFNKTRPYRHGNKKA